MAEIAGLFHADRMVESNGSESVHASSARRSLSLAPVSASSTPVRRDDRSAWRPSALRPRREAPDQRLRRAGAGHDPGGVLEAVLRAPSDPEAEPAPARPRALPGLLQPRPRPHRPLDARPYPRGRDSARRQRRSRARAATDDCSGSGVTVAARRGRCRRLRTMTSEGASPRGAGRDERCHSRAKQRNA